VIDEQGRGWIDVTPTFRYRMADGSVVEIDMHEADAWDRLAKIDIGKYSMLKVAYDMGFPFSHVHREDSSKSERSALDVDPPRCHGKWMWAAPDGWRCREADAGVIKRVESGKSVYLRKPRRYLAGDKKGEPIPGDFDYMEIEKARFDSMVKEHGAPPAGVEPVEIEGFREEKRRAAVGNLVDLWATTSNSTNARALAMQEIARDIFSLEGTADWPPVGELPELRGEIDRARETHGPRIEAFLRAQYAATQERLAAAGITEVPVFRGVKTYGEAPAWIESGDVKLRPLSSFSSDRTIAALFGYDERGGHMLTGTVPAARVLSTPRTGTGALEEAEFVVLGGPASWDITSISAADLPAAQIQTRDELITAIAAADAPDRRIALAAVAGKLGLARLIPEDWQTKAAKPSHAWPDALNEDWPKALSWDVRASTGEPVESLALLSEITGESDLRTLAQSLLDGPSAGVAPAALLAEAQAAIAGEPLAREPWPQEVTGAASGGRKVIADGTLRAMGATGRQRPHLVVEEKLVHPFDPDKHPRDHHGRWAHTPGAGFAHTVERVAAADLRIGDHVVTGDKPARRVSNISHRQVRLSPKRSTRYYRLTFDDGSHEEISSRQKVERAGAPINASATVSGAFEPIKREGRPDGTGTVDDPIEVGDDLTRAAQLLADGKHVRLDQTEQVATLVDKLRELVEHARARGEKAPVYDLCRVSVPGTNLFCKQSKGIPRIKMPQFRGDDVRPGSPAEAFRGPNGKANIEQPFRDALAAMGIPTRLTTIPASHLRASQNELDGGKVSQLVEGIESGRVKEQPIFVTRDNYIIDGHHRWAGQVAVDTRDGRLGDVMMPVEVVDLDIGAALDYANAFMKVMGLASQSVDAPHSRKVISLTVPSLPPDFKERMTKALAEEAPTDAPVADETPVDEVDVQDEEVLPVDDSPRPSRIAEGLDAVYGATAVHHVGRAIDAVYAAEPEAKAAALDVPDLASIGHPEPGAEPVGAHAFFVGPDGVEAWLDTSGGEPVGYFRDAARPYRAVRVDDARAWAAIVDHLGLHEDPVPTQRTPAPVLTCGRQ
jgi:hypothetical protein